MPNPKKPRNRCLNCHEETKRFVAIYCSNKCQVKYQRNQMVKENFKDACPKTIRSYLLETRGHNCEICNRKTWQGKPIPLEQDHIDGNSQNNKLTNLRLLCCNCHAQTPTWGSGNLGNGRHFRRLRYSLGKSR
jgi:hypothetical protein